MGRWYQAEIDAKVKLLVWIYESEDGHKEVDEILDVIGEVTDFENVRET